MVYLTYENKVFNFSEEIFKISTYLENIAKDRLNESEPLPLLKCNDEIFNIFTKWFNELKHIGIVKIENEIMDVIFKIKLFEELDFKILIELFNFGFYNQIKLLCDTIAFMISRECKIEIINDKYYVSNNKYTIINNTYYKELLQTHQYLTMMILKNMPCEKYKLQPEILQNLAENTKIELLITLMILTTLQKIIYLKM